MEREGVTKREDVGTSQVVTLVRHLIHNSNQKLMYLTGQNKC